MGHKPGEDGVIRYSQWIPGASDSGPDDEPRSFWERLMREEAAQNARKAATQRKPIVTSKTVLGAPRPEFGPQPGPAPAMAFRPRLPQPDPNTKIKVNTMAPTRAFMRGDRMISPETVMGARRPEFGPRAAELETGLQAGLGIRTENGQPTYRPTAEQKQVIKDQLAARGMPTDQVDDLKFVRGLDDKAGFFTRTAFGGDATKAVTQGNTVYVQPTEFVDVVGFNSDTPFEEAYHSADFALEGGAGFYPPYIVNALGGFGIMGDEYNGNTYEAFAKGAAKKMREAYQRQRQGGGK